jgi:eukaryotic-like serine/threonine-protein kinase
MSLRGGQRLQNGKYTIEREIGRGRVGITYLAKRANGERWVIKVLDPQVVAGLSNEERDRLESMFWQEAVKLAKCSGTPHIVTAQMPFKEGSVICLPMEYVAGSNLGDRDQPKLSEAAAINYMQQIGEALAVVHRQNLVHRDICPANIFVRIREGKAEAVLTDFGLAVDCDTELSRTREQECMDGFSPIELYARGQAVGPYTDVYSLAATLYELLTGEVPVSAEARSLRGEVSVSPQVKNPDISGKTAKAILTGMELLPEKRPQSVEAWLNLLKTSQSTSKPGAQESGAQKGVNWTKWQTIWGAVGVICAIVIGIPAWLALKQPDSPPAPSSAPSSTQVPSAQ